MGQGREKERKKERRKNERKKECRRGGGIKGKNINSIPNKNET
jgi:hypothetical protein